MEEEESEGEEVVGEVSIGEALEEEEGVDFWVCDAVGEAYE